MRRTAVIGILIFASFFSACSQTQSDKDTNHKNQTTMDHPYPFQVMENNEQFTILAPIENDDLFNKYYPIFEKHGYEGNGYCWEGHIIQILEKKDKELLNHIEFDPEAGGFYAYADSKATQIRFINLLSPIFSDLQKLEAFVISAERNRIDD